MRENRGQHFIFAVPIGCFAVPAWIKPSNADHALLFAVSTLFTLRHADTESLERWDNGYELAPHPRRGGWEVSILAIVVESLRSRGASQQLEHLRGGLCNLLVFLHEGHDA